MVLGGPRSDSVPVRWNQVVAMLDPYPYPYPYPAIGREMRSLAPAAEAETGRSSPSSRKSSLLMLAVRIRLVKKR